MMKNIPEPVRVKGERSENVTSFGTDEEIRRIVEQYSPMLLHLAAARLNSAADAEDAVLLNETVNSGDYAITLLGLTSGEALTTWDQNAEVSHTYAVLALRRLDGAALENRSFAFTSYTMTPLVAGYAPTAVNNWTLDALATGFAQDGVYYYLLDTQDLGIFADHTVYIAFYEGGAPSSSIFTMAEDGAISFAEDFTGVQALFTLPLDDSLADPAAAAKYVQDTGWSNDLSVTSEDREGGILIGGEDADGGVTASFHVSDGSEALDLYTAETYEAYMLEEKERLRQEVDKGVLSQVNYSTSVKEMEEVLEGIRNGTMFAARLENGGVLTGTVLDAQGFSGEYQTTRDGVSMTIRDSKD